ncbi:MAG: hypothetical protein E6G05_09305 [Actinobacteria bacterium]|nr:MAG: hypothetical protein E6G05_09305 [Actinomycetota bacterium]
MKPRSVGRIGGGAVLAVPLFLIAAVPAAADSGSEPPAGGGAIGQVIGATLGAAVVTAALLALIAGHRSGRVRFLGRAARWCSRAFGLAGWAGLPIVLLVGVSLLVAVFGMYWDISLHLDNGRDPGPLANPAHYFILAGLFCVLASGVIAIALTGERRPSDTAIRLPNGWWAPLGALVICACGAVSLIAFPLDDIWHRIFGQDVTLWGPTHLLLIGGATFSILGAWILYAEGSRRAGQTPPRRPRLLRSLDAVVVGALLVGLSTFQAEFDFGVPQFRLVWQPILLALAAGIGLVAARVRNGRGGALTAALVFIAIRGFLALLVGPIIGQTTPHFPLYLVEAGLVELVGLRYDARRPMMLGAVAGVLIGTVGFAAEYGWQALIAYIPWPPSLIAEGVTCALVAGTAGGVLGAWIGRSVAPRERSKRAPRWLVPAAGLAAVAVMTWALPMPNGSQLPRATVSVHDVAPPPHREVVVTARLRPANAADGARWFVVTAWQGGGAVVAPMNRLAPGIYRAARPVPVWGPKWKSTIRLQRGRAVLGLPIYMPRDEAIPVAGIPAPARFTRPFERDKKLLQREQKGNVPGFLTLAAYLFVLLIWSGMVAIVSWALWRLAKSTRAARRSPGRARRKAPRRTPATPARA